MRREYIFNPDINLNGVVQLYGNDDIPSSMLWSVEEIAFIASNIEEEDNKTFYTVDNGEGMRLLVSEEDICNVIDYGDSEQITLSKKTKSVRVLTPEERSMTNEQRIDLALDKLNYADTIGRVLHTKEELEEFKKDVYEDLKRFTEEV